MFKRQQDGTCPCLFCGHLIAVQTTPCPHCGQSHPSFWGYAGILRGWGSDCGFSAIALWGCILLYSLTLVTNLRQIENDGLLNLLAPSNLSLLLFGASGAVPVFELNRWWTVLSAGWLHGNLLHILFNLLWVRELAPAVARGFGAARLVIIYTVAVILAALLSSLAGQFLQSLPPFLQGARMTIGASGGIFGLLGALVAYGQRTGNALLGQRAMSYAIALFLLGFVMANVDNWGHLGGFLGGYLICWVGGMDPRQAEGLRHWGLAIACLLLTLLSILASIGHGLWLLHP